MYLSFKNLITVTSFLFVLVPFNAIAAQQSRGNVIAVERTCRIDLQICRQEFQRDRCTISCHFREQTPFDILASATDEKLELGHRVGFLYVKGTLDGYELRVSDRNTGAFDPSLWRDIEEALVGLPKQEVKIRVHTITVRGRRP